MIEPFGGGRKPSLSVKLREETLSTDRA